MIYSSMSTTRPDRSRLLKEWRKRMGIEPTSRAATARDNGFEVGPRDVMLRQPEAANANAFNHLLRFTPNGPCRTDTPVFASYCAKSVPRNRSGGGSAVYRLD